MPVAHSTIAYRKSRRLRQIDSRDDAYDDDLWEKYDDALLSALPSSVPVAVKSEPADSPSLSHSAEGGHIRRPRNAFICFRSAYVKAEKSESARPETINQTAMSCSAGAVWRGLSAEERRPYIVMAQEEKLEHALKYPDYRYTPASACGAARKERKPKPKPSAARRRGSSSSTSADSNAFQPAARSSKRKYASNPPAARPVSRKKPTASTTSASASAPAAPAPIPIVPKVEPVAEASVTESIGSEDKKAPEPVSWSPVRPSTYHRTPRQFGSKKDSEHRSPAPIVPTLDSPAPSRPPSPSPSEHIPTFSLPPPPAPTVPALDAPAPTRPPSPPPADHIPPSSSPESDLGLGFGYASPPSPAPSPAAAAFEWDAWIYTPLEMNEDEDDDDAPLQFDAPAADFGFFHPWNFDQPSTTADSI